MLKYILILCILFCLIQSDDETRRFQKHQVRKVYNNLIYPKPVPIVSNLSIVLPGLFADNVRGRVIPTADFDGKFGVIEYFYGLGNFEYIHNC